MKVAVRALGIAITALWIFLIVFSVTALYSVMNLDVGFGESQFFPSGEGAVFSLPFYLNNSGYYDISMLNLTTLVTDSDGTLITRARTSVPLVAKGSNIETVHNISVDLSDIVKNMGLLFNDSLFEFDTVITLNFAHTFPVQISLNTTVPWGAPLYDVSLGEITIFTFNITHVRVAVSLSFENHSFFDITGTTQLEIYNDGNELVTFGETSLDVRSQHAYNEQVAMYLSLVDISRLSGSGRVRVIFETHMFTVERWIPYG